MTKKMVEVFAPATIANVGCGLDIFGLAVDKPGDIIRAIKTEEKGIRISKIKGADNLPTDPKKNTATVSIQALLKTYKKPLSFGIEVEIEKLMPLKSGMGSSAASSVAGVFAANELLGRPFTKKELVNFALEGEFIACGAKHADNVAPCMVGGFVGITEYSPLQFHSIPLPKDISFLLIHPHVEISTEVSRKIIKQQIPIKNHIKQTGHVVGVLSGLYLNDISMFCSHIQDHILEPVRSMLIPGYAAITSILKKNGALAANISGSGPTIFAIFSDEEKRENARKKVASFFEKSNIKVDFFLANPDNKGARVISER